MTLDKSVTFYKKMHIYLIYFQSLIEFIDSVMKRCGCIFLNLKYLAIPTLFPNSVEDRLSKNRNEFALDS